MKNLESIAEDLFEKIRGRFPSLTIGDKDGNITNVPKNARYFDFSFTNNNENLGKVSVSLDEENGITVVVGKDIAQNQTEDVQDRWYNFLKELRIFAKKRLLTFDVRDINKSNLNKRDYKFLAANRPGENTMSESRMYGTNKTSYQRIGNARLAIKHTQPINVESVGGRSQKIGAIYIESPEGERFKYPYRHLAGARAMARHVSEGGNAYDDFGKYISGLSEEAVKLQKFKAYMNRSSVMAETLAGYMDSVNERVQAVKKEIHNLQKEAYYKESVENFTVQVVEEVPEDVAENWIDQLTIKQFNEELKDVFPYIYKLVGEATRAVELGPEDLVAEDSDPCWKNYKMVGMKKKGGREVPNCVPKESEEVDESGLQYYTGKKKYGKEGMAALAKAGREGASEEELGRIKDKYKKEEIEVDEAEKKGLYYYVNKRKKAGTSRPKNHPKAPSAQDWKDAAKTAKKESSISPEEIELEAGFDRMMGQFGEDEKEYSPPADSTMSPLSDTPEKQKTPLGEFILSYFDRETGQFPKGETAVLTMVEKDYGEEFIEPAKAFIEKVNNLVGERFGFKEPDIQEDDIDENLGKGMKKFKKWYDTDPRDVKDRIRKADPEFRDKIKKNQNKLGGAAELQRRLARKMDDNINDISRLAGLR